MSQTNRPLTATTKSATSTPTPPAAGPPAAAPQAEPITKEQPVRTQPLRRTVRFEANIPNARSVSVVGNFNDWKPGATPLASIGGTTWFRDLSLVPGRYEYRFVVDGKWVDPPHANAYVPNPHGGRNAVVVI